SHPPRSPLFPYTTLFRSRRVDRRHELVALLDLRTGGGDIHLALDAVLGEALRERPDPLQHLAPRDAHLLGRRHADVEEEIGVVRSEEHTSELQSPYDLVC